MLTAWTLRRVMARAALLAAVALAGGAVPACGNVHSGGPGQGGPVIARYASNGKTVHVSVGGKVEVILSSTYWNLRGSSVPAVVHQDGPAVTKAAPMGQCVPGQGCGTVRATFTARSAGTAVLTAHRVSCGEALACGPSQRSFRLTVKVG